MPTEHLSPRRPRPRASLRPDISYLRLHNRQVHPDSYIINSSLQCQSSGFLIAILPITNRLHYEVDVGSDHSRQRAVEPCCGSRPSCRCSLFTRAIHRLDARRSRRQMGHRRMSIEILRSFQSLTGDSGASVVSRPLPISHILGVCKTLRRSTTLPFWERRLTQP